VLDYYRDPLAWFALVGTTALLTYGGGAVMFWFHAIYLGEAGPSLIPVMHWLVDSTLGFAALAPALLLLIPVALRKAERPQTGVVPPWRFAILAGAAFAIITAPGPLIHDAAVGQGKWLAVHITLVLTKLLGNWVFRKPAAGPVTEVPPLANLLLQVDVGLPTYVLIMRLSYRFHTADAAATAKTGAGAEVGERAPSRFAFAGAGLDAAPGPEPAGALTGGAALIASLMGGSNGQHGSGGMNHDGLGGVPAYYDINGGSAGNGAAAPAAASTTWSALPDPQPAPATPASSPAASSPAAPRLGPLGLPKSIWQKPHSPEPANGYANGYSYAAGNGNGNGNGNGTGNGGAAHGTAWAAVPAPDPDPGPSPGPGQPDWPLDDVDTGQWLASRAAIEPGSHDDLDVEQWLQQLAPGW